MPSILDPASPPDPQADEQPAAAGKSRRRKRVRMVGWGGLVLVALIVLPPFISVNHFRRSVLSSVSAGLGRPVHASAVDIALFPRPAFVLHNLTVAEDPAYGAEPVLMAGEVTASLRASTLWHWRVEIASLSFDAPSLNLARNAAGHWDFESLLRNSPALHTRPAPGSMPRPSFPYIEATDARINFKFGPEKLPFSLEGADLAVWKGPGNEWHVRIRAHPVRTDLTAANGGEIRGEGVLRAVGPLADSPLHAHLEWRQVELGEIGRLLHGEDNGWRGLVDWTAQANGTLARTLLTAKFGIEAFHRAEFIPSNDMDLAARCRGEYALGNRLLDSVDCIAPLGSGQLSLHGGFREAESAATGPSRRPAPPRVAVDNRRSNSALPFAPPSASMQIALRHVPAGFFLNLLRHVHPGVAEDAAANGEVNGEVDCAWPGLDTVQRCSGQIHSAAIAIAVPGMEQRLRFSPVFVETSGASDRSKPPIKSRKMSSVPTEDVEKSGAPGEWTLAPARISLGGTAPATVTGTLNSSGSTLKISGDAKLAEVAQLAAAFKIPAFSGELRPIRGNAQLALSLTSAWLPQMAIAPSDAPDRQFGQFAPSRWAGSLEIHDAVFHLASLPGTLQIGSARVNFVPGSVEWTHLKGTFADTAFNGSLRWQTPCMNLRSICGRSFTLHTPDLNASRLQAALRQEAGGSDLFRAIDPWAASSPGMPEISGTFSADALSAGRLSMQDVVLRLRLHGHNAQLLGISGKMFGGAMSGSAPAIDTATASSLPTRHPDGGEIGSLQWGEGPPVYTLRVTLDNIRPNRVAAIWRENWGTGSANAQIDLKTHGWSADDLARNASGKFSIAWFHGSLPPSIATPSANAAEIENFQRWSAEGTIRNRTLVLASSNMVPRSGKRRKRGPGTQSVTGTVTFGRVLDLKLHPSRIAIVGPLKGD